jgi:muramoyltetrapeptide carboxypeptidase LdcA involved in peptidoglycan recycling
MRMNKIRGTPRTELARRTGRTGSIQADCDDVREENTRLIGGNLETIGDLAEANLRPLFYKSRMLAQTVDEKFFLLIQQRIVDGSSAKIHSGHE